MRTYCATLLLTAFIALSSFGQGSVDLQSADTRIIPNPASESIAGAEMLKSKKRKVIVVTGTRFAYPLVQQWIDDYNEVQPNVQIIIESRGSGDPASDILIEAYEQDEAIKKTRDYVYVARYAVLPVANSKSEFAKTYASKGLNKALINQFFFHDLFAETENEQKIKSPFTIYTRLQKAGAPIVFTRYFGFEQKDIRGKAIAGSDEHLLKAILRDSLAVSYLPLTLIYNHASGKAIDGLTVLPPDMNGNDRVSEDEKFYNELSTVIQRLEGKETKDIKNIPIAYLHLSVDKSGAAPEASDFLKWVAQSGQSQLHSFGYLLPKGSRVEAESRGTH